MSDEERGARETQGGAVPGKESATGISEPAPRAVPAAPTSPTSGRRLKLEELHAAVNFGPLTLAEVQKLKAGDSMGFSEYAREMAAKAKVLGPENFKEWAPALREHYLEETGLAWFLGQERQSALAKAKPLSPTEL